MTSAYLFYAVALYVTQSIAAGHSQVNGHVALVLQTNKDQNLFYALLTHFKIPAFPRGGTLEERK